jgi:HD-GYP domain-containing protein (c-di-GMP phosphodiesterase class II)
VKNRERWLLKNIEGLIILTILISVMLLNYFIYSKVAFLNFYYLPVIIGGYYLGRRLAVLGAFFTILMVWVFVLANLETYLLHTTKFDLYFNLIIWAGFLVITGWVIGQLSEKLREDLIASNNLRLEITQRLSRAAEFKDCDTGLHILRMSHIARLIADTLDVDEEWAELIFHAAPMHDVGKIGIPDKILLKAGKLDPDEWEVMKSHASIGGEILSGGTSELMKMSEAIAMTHHEKWDGSGYPEGLKGENIPLEGRIVAVADVLDALTSIRPYKEAWPMEKAIAQIEEQSGKQFDPKVVEALKNIIPDILAIESRFVNQGEKIEVLT